MYWDNCEQMKTEAVFFDKDGTLLDFDALWVTVSEHAIKEILSNIGVPNIGVRDVLESLGVHKGITDINSVLSYGTYMQISESICAFLMKNGCTVKLNEIVAITDNAYKNAADKGKIVPACEDICGVLQKIKDKGIKIALVTTDGPFMTDKCIDTLKIRDYFDRIYTADGEYPPKPNPYCINDFCGKYGINKQYAVMVGDTLTDVEFAKNGGIRMIGIAKSENNKTVLQRATDTVVSDISLLPELI